MRTNLKERVLNFVQKTKALYYRLKNPGTGFFMISIMAFGKFPLLFLELKNPAAWSTTVSIYGCILNTLCLYASYLVYKSSLEMYYRDPPRKLTFFEVLTALVNGFFGFFFELKDLIHSYITELFAAKTVKTNEIQAVRPVILADGVVVQPAVARRASMPGLILDSSTTVQSTDDDLAVLSDLENQAKSNKAGCG